MIVKPSAIIVDMDGTLVDVSSIRYHVRGGRNPDGSYKKKDFTAFHEESVNCPPILRTVSMVDSLRMQGYKIIIVTARSKKFYPQTAWWLAENEIEHHAIYMRADGDYRPDYEVKKDLLVRIRNWWEPVHAFDDNPNVVRLWVEEGIPTTVIPGWEH